MMRPELTMSVYLCREPVEMRKSIDGLSLLVQEAMELNPFDEAIFVFCNRQRDKVKILAWERNGFVLWYKRLGRVDPGLFFSQSSSILSLPILL